MGQEYRKRKIIRLTGTTIRKKLTTLKGSLVMPVKAAVRCPGFYANGGSFVFRFRLGGRNDELSGGRNLLTPQVFLHKKAERIGFIVTVRRALLVTEALV